MSFEWFNVMWLMQNLHWFIALLISIGMYIHTLSRVP